MSLPPELARYALFENHAGVILLDAQRRIVFWNRWLEQHSGITTEQALGQTLSLLFPAAGLRRLERHVAAAVEAGQSSVLSYPLNRAPLPLYASRDTDAPRLIAQTTVVKPLMVPSFGRYCFVKIVDVSSAVAREQLLREQGEALRKLAERHRHGEAKARAIIENISEALVITDADCNVLDLNRAAHALFGYSDEAILGQPFSVLVSGDDGRGMDELVNDDNVEIRGVTVDGTIFPAELTASRISDDDLQRTIFLIRNLTERKRYEAEIFEEKEFAQVTLHAIKEAVITTDAAGIVYSCNAAACALLGGNETDLVGKPLVESLLVKTGEQVPNVVDVALGKALRCGEGTEFIGDPELQRRDGMHAKIAGSITPMRDQVANIIGSVTVLQDVSVERRMQEVLSYQATHDELTELINRREFERRLESVVERQHADGHSVLLYLDLDQFKLINDSCGHAAGDKLLRQLTSIMKVQVRQSDTFARLGGDEFGVLLPGCDQSIGQRIATALRDTVKQFRFRWNDSTYGLGVSIGLVVIDESWKSVADVMSAADSACYMAKEAGRDQVVMYQPSGDKEQRRRGEISQAVRIRESLEKNRFRLYCQPIMPLAEKGPEDWGIEILIRMIDDDGSLVPPGSFIPAAERYDLMTYIDRWVVDAVCQHWLRRPNDFLSLEKIAINLSGLSVANDEFLQFLIQRLASAALPWDKVCLEITETAAVNSIEKAQNLIAELSGRGCRFSLDDFGSGLSSFAYLKNLPVDYLKIDGAFVRDMLNDPMDAAMVRSIANIGKALGLQTIAEFVEDATVMSALREAEVDYAQGYGICPPMPLEALEQWRKESLRQHLYHRAG